MAEENKTFLALGSNLGKRYKNLQDGIYLLNNHAHIWVTEKSHIYQSEPMYNDAQDDYYNMVLEVETNLNPLDLLDEIKIIESKLGRPMDSLQNMPRIIDIDILAIGDMIVRSNILEVPHPRITERKFVLKPWHDIAPKFIIAGINKNVGEALNEVTSSSSVNMLLIVDQEI